MLSAQFPPNPPSNRPPSPSKPPEPGMHIMCTICQDIISFAELHDIRVLECGHVFHMKCLVSWFRRSKTCPHCRVPVHRKHIVRPYLDVCRAPDAPSAALDAAKYEVENLKSTVDQLTKSNQELARKAEMGESYKKQFLEQKRYGQSQKKLAEESAAEAAYYRDRAYSLERVQFVLEAPDDDVEQQLQRNQLDKETLSLLIMSFKRNLTAERKRSAELYRQLQEERAINSKLRAHKSRIVNLLQIVDRVNDHDGSIPSTSGLQRLVPMSGENELVMPYVSSAIASDECRIADSPMSVETVDLESDSETAPPEVINHNSGNDDAPSVVRVPSRSVAMPLSPERRFGARQMVKSGSRPETSGPCANNLTQRETTSIEFAPNNTSGGSNTDDAPVITIEDSDDERNRAFGDLVQVLKKVGRRRMPEDNSDEDDDAEEDSWPMVPKLKKCKVVTTRHPRRK